MGNASEVQLAPGSPERATSEKIGGSSDGDAARAVTTGGENHVIAIRPRKGFATIGLRELWEFRDLAFMLSLRDIKVRYKQAVMGAAWAVFQPIASMVVFTLVFGKLAGMDQQLAPGVPYEVFLYSGLLGWQFFEASVNASSQSLIANANMLRKIYFPRLIMPLSAVGAPLVDYMIALVVLFGIMVWFGVGFTINLLWLPLLVLSTILAALSVGVLLAALTVSYRDFKYAVPFMMKIWFFITPVLYGRNLVPEKWAWVMDLNPMAGPIQGFRAAILADPENYPMSLASWGISTAVSLVLLTFGLIYFSRVERRFADIV